jgi:HEAT repeat protein
VHVKVEFKLRKAIREKTLEFPEFATDLRRFRKRGLSVVDALKALLGETGPRSGRSRAAAAQILSRSGAAHVTKILLQQLRLAREYAEVFAVVSLLASVQERRAFASLLKILALSDADRSQAAAYYLRNKDTQAIPALISVVSDASRPARVRAEAAESLGCFGDPRAIPVLLFALDDESPELRFWAVFALGHWVKTDDRVKPGLLTALTDRGVAPGWWSVAQEAKAVLTECALLQSEIREILSNPNASGEDRRWAECYEEYRF